MSGSIKKLTNNLADLIRRSRALATGEETAESWTLKQQLKQQLGRAVLAIGYKLYTWPSLDNIVDPHQLKDNIAGELARRFFRSYDDPNLKETSPLRTGHAGNVKGWCIDTHKNISRELLADAKRRFKKQTSTGSDLSLEFLEESRRLHVREKESPLGEVYAYLKLNRYFGREPLPRDLESAWWKFLRELPNLAPRHAVLTWITVGAGFQATEIIAVAPCIGKNAVTESWLTVTKVFRTFVVPSMSPTVHSSPVNMSVQSHAPVIQLLQDCDFTTLADALDHDQLRLELILEMNLSVLLQRLCALEQADEPASVRELDRHEKELLTPSLLVAVTKGDPRALLLADRLGRFLDRLGRYDLALEVYEKLALEKHQLGKNFDLVIALGYSKAAWRRGHRAAALASAKKARRLARALSDKVSEARALNLLAHLAELRGRYSVAIRMQARALRELQACPQEDGLAQFEQASTLNNMGLVKLHHGESVARNGSAFFDEAVALFTKALTAWKNMKNEFYLAMAQSNIGAALRRLGRLEESRREQEAALEVRRKLGDSSGQASSHDRLDQLASDSGDWQAAVREHEHALRLWRELNHRYGVGWSSGALGRAKWSLGEVAEAKQCYANALTELGFQHAWPDVLAVCQYVADLLRGQGLEQEAAGLSNRAAKLFAALRSGKIDNRSWQMLVYDSLSALGC